MYQKVTNISHISVQFTAQLSKHSLWNNRDCVKTAGGVEGSSRHCLAKCMNMWAKTA